MKKSVSIVIPAYNDEKSLEANVKSINSMAKKLFDDYEILIFDDFSTDSTGQIVDSLAARNSRVRAFHNRRNMNVGYNFRMGIRFAAKDYVVLLPAPDSMLLDSIRNFMSRIGEADIVVSYTVNKKARPLYRQLVSAAVTLVLNLLFGLRLKYYFGMQAYETRLVRKVKTTTNSFGIFPEILVRLVKRGYSCREVPIYAREGSHDSTTAFRIRNMAGIVNAVARLFFAMRFRRV